MFTVVPLNLPNNQKSDESQRTPRSSSRGPLICLAIPAHETRCWALIWKLDNCNWDCAYARGFPVLAGLLPQMAVCSFMGKNFGWMYV
jgi:hypothetical protein